MTLVLVTGGTGTLGRVLTNLLLQDPGIQRIRVLSRGEHKQMEMERQFAGKKIDFLVGDVRDYSRVLRASQNCTSIFHLAAFKSVDKAEYDPWECILTNVKGTQNVIRAAIENEVSRCLFTSSDKAVSPFNIYGCSKLCAEKLWIQGNVGLHKTSFCATRYGNVLGSTGSVLQRFEKQRKQNPPIFTVTHPNMTRFWMTLKEAAQFVLRCHKGMASGGQVFVPKMKSSDLIKFLNAFQFQPKYKIVGRRPGEKDHEILISIDEIRSGLVRDLGWGFALFPPFDLYPTEKTGQAITPQEYPQGYTSAFATRFSHEELKEMIHEQNR